MKKLVSCLLVAALALPMFAQEEAANEYLPAAGDFAIGFNVNPFTNYIGQLFNGSSNGSIDNNAIGGSGLLINGETRNIMSPLSVASLQGKYMLTDNLGVRANLGLLLNRRNTQEYVANDEALVLDPLSRAKVIDGLKYSSCGGSFSAGVEYRLGQKRVQAVFSGSLLYAYNTEKTTYSYGNGITEYNQAPTHSSTLSTYTGVSGAMPNARPLTVSTEGTHYVGVVGGVGVEGFVAPKISLGAEVNLALIYAWTPATYTEYEGYNILNGKVEKFTELTAPKNSEFVFGTQNIGANLFMNFYFNR